MADALNMSSAPFPADVDEFAAAGLATAPGRAVACPRVAQSPAALECKLADIHRLRGADGAAAEGWLVIGEVVGVHICCDHVSDGRFDTAHAGIIQRAGYSADYAEITPDIFFAMPRPRAPKG